MLVADHGSSQGFGEQTCRGTAAAQRCLRQSHHVSAGSSTGQQEVPLAYCSQSAFHVVIYKCDGQGNLPNHHKQSIGYHQGLCQCPCWRAANMASLQTQSIFSFSAKALPDLLGQQPCSTHSPVNGMAWHGMLVLIRAALSIKSMHV